MGLQGVYVGRKRVREFLNLLGPHGLKEGWLNDHIQLQTIVDVSADGNTAWVRSRELGMTGEYQKQGAWSEGIYENTFVKQDGVWKIKALRYYPFWHGSFEDGWAKTPMDFIPMANTTWPQDPLDPDALIDPAPRLWPATDIVPFHYPHPVTGQPIEIDNSRAREGYAD